MSGLAHYFEEEGLATVLVALVREHAEKMNPPRALWVPFELGRPLGAPADVPFQRKVIDAAFALLDKKSGPVLENFDEEAPIDAAKEEEEEPWACAVSFSLPQDDTEKPLAERVKDEIEEMEPWYEQAKARRGKTMVGISQLSLEEAVDFLAGFLDLSKGDPVIPEKTDHDTLHNAFKYATEDLKVYYQEAALAQPGKPKRGELNNWFYMQTEAGKFLIEVCEHALHAKDRFTAGMAWGNIIPMALRHLTTFPEEFPNYPRPPEDNT